MLKQLKQKIKLFLFRNFPEFSLRILLKKSTGEHLNLKEPQTFNEKIQWLKLYDYPSNPLVIECADKLKMHDYLKRKGLEKYSVKVIGAWDHFDEIPWKSLPNKFVLKMTHGSGFNIFIENKDNIDLKKVKEQINIWQNIDFGLVSLEKHYSKIEPKIIAEEYLNLSEDNLEYNFYCFHGEIKFCRAICFEDKILKTLKGTCYSRSWEKLPYNLNQHELSYELAPPDNLKELLNICCLISKDFPFVRVDFIKCKDQIILGELTFSPASGFVTSFSNSAQLKMGEWLLLPTQKTLG